MDTAGYLVDYAASRPEEKIQEENKEGQEKISIFVNRYSGGSIFICCKIYAWHSRSYIFAHRYRQYYKGTIFPYLKGGG